MKVLLLFASLVAIGCGVTQPVRTLEEGKTEILVSLGGPVIPLEGFAVPAPYLNLGMALGYSDDLTIFTNAHITALLFKDIGLDGGVATRLTTEERMVPEITLNSRMYFFWDFVRSNNKRLFPMVTVVGSYQTGNRSWFYFGVDHLFQLHQPDVFISPLAGYQFSLSVPMTAQVEVKWLAANKNTRHGIFEGTTSIGGAGGMGIFFGANYKFR